MHEFRWLWTVGMNYSTVDGGSIQRIHFFVEHYAKRAGVNVYIYLPAWRRSVLSGCGMRLDNRSGDWNVQLLLRLMTCMFDMRSLVFGTLTWKSFCKAKNAVLVIGT